MSDNGRGRPPAVSAWAFPVVAAAASGLALALGIVWLGVIAGVVLFWCLGTGIWQRPLPAAALDAAVIPTALGLAVVGLTSLVLADFDLFDPVLVWVLVAGGAIALGVVRSRRRRPLLLSRGGAAGLATLAIVPAVVPVAPFVYGGRDAGLYVLAADLIRHHGTMIVHDPLGTHLPLALRPQLTDFGIRFMGVLPMDVDGGRVVPHGLHLLPATMAAGSSLSGGRGLWVVCLGGVLMVLSTARLAQLLSPRRYATVAAVIAAALLASNAALIYFSRFPMAETLSGALLLAGSLATAIALKERSAGTALVAGGILGASLAARIDAYPALLIVAVVAAWAWAVMGERRVALGLAVGVGVPALIAALHAHYVAWYYTTANLNDYSVAGHTVTVKGVILGTAVVLALIALVALVVERVPRLRRFLGAGPEWFVPVVVGVLAVALANWLLLLAVDNSSESLVLIRSYVHSEVLLVGLAGGAAVAIAAARDKRFAIVVVPLLLFAAAMIAYGNDAKVSLDQYWAARRFLPVQMPVISALAGATVALLLLLLSGRVARRVAVAGALAVTLGLVGFSMNEARPALSVTEYSTLPRQLDTLNRSLGPPSTLVLVGLNEYAQARIAPALWLHYGRPTVSVSRADETPLSPPVSVDLSDPRLGEWILSEARRRPVVLVASQLAQRTPIVNPSQLRVQLQASQVFDVEIAERAIGHPPDKTFHELATVDVFRISPAAGQ